LRPHLGDFRKKTVELEAARSPAEGEILRGESATNDIAVSLDPLDNKLRPVEVVNIIVPSPDQAGDGNLLAEGLQRFDDASSELLGEIKLYYFLDL